MTVSVFDLFKIGVGPSSSHTVGPMVAARRFLDILGDRLRTVARVRIELYGSLALTGVGHGSDKAILLGLSGERPSQVDPDIIEPLVARIHSTGRLMLDGCYDIAFHVREDLIFAMEKRLPFHSNAMLFQAYDGAGDRIAEETYYSIGGGFVVSQDEAGRNAPTEGPQVPYPFASAAELLDIGVKQKLTIAEIVMANERVVRGDREITQGLDAIWSAMEGCIERGCTKGGILPGGLEVERRAPKLYAKLLVKQERALSEPLAGLDWINLWALAVNEENAAGGRVVTAPTNGAAGIIPAVLRYYDRFCRSSPEGIHTFLLTAAAIGALFKRNASISGAEVGCQGEVGVACSMAAAGLTAALGGTNEQIENAAEIGMEHNLGLTCDPVGGLVQIPCIERNAMGSIKAIDASRLAMLGDGKHKISLDKVIETMRQTGADMSDKYKETSKGGLAVNVVEC